MPARRIMPAMIGTMSKRYPERPREVRDTLQPALFRRQQTRACCGGARHARTGR